MAGFSIAAPGMNVTDALSAAGVNKPALGGKMTNAKAMSTAQDFESMFLNSMFSQMFTETKGDGPMGGNGATGVWRSFLTDEYAKSFAKAGGVGIAKEVYGALIARQAAQS